MSRQQSAKERPFDPGALGVGWQAIELFLAIAEAGSFSAAAKRLGTTQPTVSRNMQALEERLGRPLFRRDVEGAHLTTDGLRLLPAAEQMARWAGELTRAAATWEDKPEGTVRIAAPPGLCYELLAPLAQDLRTTLPEINLELLAGIEHIDLSRGQADLALRTRRPTEPELVVLLEVTLQPAVFVSARYPKPVESVRTLADLDWVTWGAPLTHLSPRPELEQLIPNFKPVFASNDYIVQLRALEEGLGAMMLGKVKHRYQRLLGLTEVPLNLALPSSSFYVVCARSMRWVPRVRAVVQELQQLLETAEGLTLRAG